MFAMKDMFRWMSAGCLTLCLTVPAFAQNQQFQDKANKAPVNGRVYAQQQAEKMQNAFKALQSCVVANDKFENDYVWDPDKTALCVPQLIAYKQSLIDLDNGPPLVFGNSAEEEALRRESKIINSLVPHIANLYGTHVDIKDYRPALYRGMKYYGELLKWNQGYANDFLQVITNIRNLLKSYTENVKKGERKDGRFIASDDVMKQLHSIRAELGKYMSYNVDSQSFALRGDGLVLISLDKFGHNFKKHSSNWLSRVENMQKRVQREVDALQNCIPSAKQIGKDSVFYGLAQLPEYTIQHHVLYLDRDFIRLSSNWAELQKGSDVFIVGKLFTFKTLEELFHKSGDSYVRAVQDYCKAVMLNTLDKDGQPLKHHIPPKGRINL